MSILAKMRFQSGKAKMVLDTEHDKNVRELLKQFARDNEGKEYFQEFYASDEISFHKGLIHYYRKVMLPALFSSMKDTYKLDSIQECDAVLGVMFSKRNKERIEEGKNIPYAIVIPMESLSFTEQGAFVSKVANLAITKYNIRFPSATEITKNMNGV